MDQKKDLTWDPNNLLGGPRSVELGVSTSSHTPEGMPVRTKARDYYSVSSEDVVRLTLLMRQAEHAPIDFIGEDMKLWKYMAGDDWPQIGIANLDHARWILSQGLTFKPESKEQL